MRCNRSTTPSSSRKAAYPFACALFAVASGALADGKVSIAFQPQEGQACTVASGDEPLIACPKSLSPSLVEGKVVTEAQGDTVTFHVPDARGLPLTISSSSTRLDIAWQNSVSGQPTSPSSSPNMESLLPGASAGATPASESGAPALATPTSGGAAPSSATSVNPFLAAVVKELPEYEADQNELIFDFSIPESPGFVVLGMVPQTVVHPRTLRELVFSLKNGIDESGNLKTGLALDFAPLQLLSGDLSIRDYLGKAPVESSFNSLNHALLNTTVSLATSKGTTSDDKSVKLGLGVHIPLIDKSDGRNDPWLRACYASAYGTAWEAIRTSQSNPENVDEEALEPAKELAQKCFTGAPSTRWNASVWTVSAGYALSSASGEYGDLESGGYGIWSSYAYGFEGAPKLLSENAQLIFHAKSLYKEHVPNPSGDAAGALDTIERDNTAVGLAFRMGKENFNVSLQGSYSWIDDRTNDRDEELRRLALGVEYKVAKDIWLVASIGGTGGGSATDDDSFVLGELKFGSAANAHFAPRK